MQKMKLLLKSEQKKKQKEIWKTKGNLLFTHEGLSGFAALDMAEEAGKMCRKNNAATVLLNIFPERSREELSLLPAKYRKEYGNKFIRSLLAEKEGLPRSLAENVASLALCEDMTGCRLTSVAERGLVSLLCDGIPLTVEKTGPMEKAMAMSGGVSLKEIDPATMESKLIKGLYFAR